MNKMDTNHKFLLTASVIAHAIPPSFPLIAGADWVQMKHVCELVTAWDREKDILHLKQARGDIQPVIHYVH